MNIPIEPWIINPIVIKRGKDYGFVIYIGTYPLYRETAREVLYTLQTMLDSRLRKT